MRRITSSLPYPHSGRQRRMGRLFAVITVVASLALSACGSDSQESQESGDTGGPIELTVWVAREQYMPTDAFMKSWNEKYPNIKIKAELQSDDALFAQLQRMLQAKQPLPDLVQVDSFYAPPMFESGVAIDMTPLMDRWRQEDPETTRPAGTCHAIQARRQGDWARHDGHDGRPLLPRGLAQGSRDDGAVHIVGPGARRRCARSNRSTPTPSRGR